MTITCHCPDEQRCGDPIPVVFCGKDASACTCTGLLFCLRCGEPLDYAIIHEEAAYWASLRQEG